MQGDIGLTGARILDFAIHAPAVCPFLLGLWATGLGSRMRRNYPGVPVASSGLAPDEICPAAATGPTTKHPGAREEAALIDAQ